MTVFGLGDLAFLGAVGTPTGPTDPFFANVSLLLHGNGTNGSTAIVDSSLNPKTVTVIGNAQISTEQSRFGGASLLNDSGSGFSVADSNEFDLQGDFTIECFMYPLTWGTDVYLFGQFEVQYYGPVVGYIAGGRPGLAVSSNKTSFAFVTNPAGVIPLNQWTHVAWTRSGNRWSVFVDGAERVLQANNATTPYAASAPLTIGRHAVGFGGTFLFNGYIDELRITKGIARYTTNFTPPAAPFPDA